MGFLSPGSVTQVATQVSPLVKKDEEVQNEAIAAIIRSLFDSNVEFVDALSEGMNSGVRAKTERLYDYAVNSDKVRKPEASFVQRDGNKGGLEKVIERIEGKPITLVYAFLGEINNVHVGYKILTENYGFDLDSGEIKTLSEQKGSPVYLKNINPVHKYSRRMKNEELQKDPLERRYSEAKGMAFMDQKLGEDFSKAVNKGLPEFTSRDNEMCRVTFWYEEEIVDREEERDEEGNIVKEKLTHKKRRQGNRLLGVGYDRDKEYHQALYTTGSGSNKRWHTFTYEDGLGRHSELDGKLASTLRDLGDYFPFIAMRMGKEDVRYVWDKTEIDEYRNMMDILGNDYDDMVDQVHENPDIDDIEQILFVFGINLKTEDPACIEYLYRFFNRVYDTRHVKGRNPANHDEVISNFTSDGNNHALLFKTGDQEISLNYRNIWKRMRNGKGKKGEYRSHIKDHRISYQYAKRTKVSRGSGADKYTYEYKTAYRDIPVLVLEYQMGESFYEQIVVANPITLFRVYKKYMTGANLNADTDDDPDKTIIPLDKSILDEMDLQSKDVVYKRAPRFVFNARVVKKLKWYESSVFRFVLTAIAIFSATISGQPWLAKIATAGLVVATKMIVIAIIKAYAIKEAGKYIAKELGAEAAIAAAVIMAAFSGKKLFDAGSLEGAPFASELMGAATGFADGVTAYFKEQIAGIASEMDEFGLMAEEKMEELKDIESTLDVDTLLDPSFLINATKPVNILGESPDDFYNRTVHSGNVGAYAFEATENFVENSLRLPTINDTLGGTL